MKKPSVRATKQEILDYVTSVEDELRIYEEKLAKLQSNTSPKEQIAKEERANNETRLKEIDLDSLYALEDMAKDFNKKFVENLDALKLIQNQISVEKDKLENVYKLKVEAESLFALVAAKKEIIESLNNKISNLEAYYLNTSKQKEDELQATLDQISLKAKYNRELQKIEFEAEMSKELRNLNDEKEELRLKTLEHEKLLDQIEVLNNKVADFEKTKEQILITLTEELKKAFKIDKDHEIALIKSEYEKELAILRCENKVTKDNMNEMVNQIVNLQELLKDSTSSITEIANKTVENYQLERSLQDIKNIAINTANMNVNTKK